MSRIAKDIYIEKVQLPTWVGLIGFIPLVVLLCIPATPVPWVLMCALALTLWLGFKLLTVWDEFREYGWFNLNRLTAYFLWPGMNVHQFLRDTCAPVIARLDWFWAFGKIGL